MQVDGYSLDAQRDKLRKYAAYEDMVVAGEYSDEGFSGIAFRYAISNVRQVLPR